MVLWSLFLGILENVKVSFWNMFFVEKVRLGLFSIERQGLS